MRSSLAFHDRMDEDPLVRAVKERMLIWLRGAPPYVRPPARRDAAGTDGLAQRRASGVPGGRSLRVEESQDMLRHILEAMSVVHPFANAASPLSRQLQYAVRTVLDLSLIHI